MATPCDSQLQQAPFDTYRDPQTGEWKLKRNQPSQAASIRNILPFRRPTEAFVALASQAK